MHRHPRGLPVLRGARLAALDGGRRDAGVVDARAAGGRRSGGGDPARPGGVRGRRGGADRSGAALRGLDGDARRRRGPASGTAPHRPDRPPPPCEGPAPRGSRCRPVTETPAATDLKAPRGGLVPGIDRIQPLLAWCEAAASAPEEPVAVDAERASSYRYS